MEVKSVDLLALQTRKMKDDIAVQGFSAALNIQLRELAGQFELIDIYSRVDHLSASVLDIIAWQFNVDWYDAENSLEIKRQAIKDALLVSRTRGTPAAVQRVVEIYFGDGKVEEWFTYGGAPYSFRVISNNRAITDEQISLFTRALESVKNIRSKLDEVIIMHFSWAELDDADYDWNSFDMEGLVWNDLPSWRPTLQISTALTFTE